ncbi:MAG: RNA methyltransferase [Gemmatimonadaceae bacterium]|nr:RNA methyltransferase [Gemmatimonadaceae bacterium]
MNLVRLARDLKRRKARERRGHFVAEGVRTVEALLASPLAVEGILVTPSLAATPRGAALAERAKTATRVDEVDEATLADAAGTDEPQGVIAVATIPQWSADTILDTAPAAARFLVLDAVQDPGNAGTMVRTAAALGASATLLLPGTVDIWNAKVVRGAMGALFTHPTLPVTSETFHAFLERAEAPCWVADALGQPIDDCPAVAGRLAIVIGNEGQGPTTLTRARADRIVSIPIAPSVESLNAAVAAGILLHACRPRSPFDA